MQSSDFPSIVSPIMLGRKRRARSRGGRAMMPPKPRVTLPGALSLKGPKKPTRPLPGALSLK